MLLSGFVLFVMLMVSYANGANDNFKGVATLYGSGTASFKSSLIWANGTTFAGALVAILLGRALARTFGRSGLIPDEVVGTTSFLASVGFAASCTVLLATRLGLPISTTHALMGSLVGAGLVAAPNQFQFAQLGVKFLLPLLIGPLIAFAVTALIYPMLSKARLALGVTRDDCACVGIAETASVPDHGLAAMSQESTSLSLTVANKNECLDKYRGNVMGFSVQAALDRVHFASAGAVSFARGLNDAPKIAALAMAGGMIPFPALVLLVGAAMLFGGLIGTKRIAETMSHRITTMNDGQGCTANLVTAVLVLSGSALSLPLSTTHVSCGSLFGLGAVTGDARRPMILRIVASWVGTLPLAALIAAVCFALLRP